jgi:hypothetical protein
MADTNVRIGTDARFPNVNQTKHCWQNYVDYHKCIIAKGEDFAPCRQVRNLDVGYSSVYELIKRKVLARLPLPVPLGLVPALGRATRYDLVGPHYYEELLTIPQRLANSLSSLTLKQPS